MVLVSTRRMGLSLVWPNNALYIVVLGRLRYDRRTRAYAERRTQQGLSKREIIRCLIG